MRTLATCLVLLCGCAQPAWKSETWLNEETMAIMDTYFPTMRIREQDSDALNGHLHRYAIPEVLRQMGEPPLPELAAPDAEVYRFTWYGAWGALDDVPCVRVEKRGGRVFIVGKVRGKNDRVRATEPRGLGASEWASLMGYLRETSLFGVTAHVESAGIDGGRWILEGVRDGQYHYLDRWSPPKDDPFRTLCETLVRLGGLGDVVMY